MFIIAKKERTCQFKKYRNIKFKKLRINAVKAKMVERKITEI